MLRNMCNLPYDYEKYKLEFENNQYLLTYIAYIVFHYKHIFRTGIR